MASAQINGVMVYGTAEEIMEMVGKATGTGGYMSFDKQTTEPVDEKIEEPIRRFRVCKKCGNVITGST